MRLATHSKEKHGMMGLGIGQLYIVWQILEWSFGIAQMDQAGPKTLALGYRLTLMIFL